MLRLFKKKYVYPEVKCPRNARELTEEGMLLVNGGGEKKEEPKTDTHTVVSGDTLSEIVYNYNKENGTNLTVDEVARNSGIEDPDTIFPGQTINLGPSGGASGTGGGSGSSGSGSGSDSTGNTPSSPSTSNKTNDATSNTVKGPNHSSTYDQKYINEMMEKDRKNALGGNGIQGNNVTGKRIEGTEIEGKGAWEVKNEWTEEYIQKYREYAPRKIEEYRNKNMKFTCEDLGLSVLIDFASENNLPVTITNGSGRYSSSDSNFSSPEEFKAKILSTTGAKDMLANTVGIAVHQLQAGDLICMDTGTPNGKQDGDYSHIQVIGETLGIRQGNLVESPFRTADYGSSSYAGMIIAGRAYDYGRDIFYGSDRTYPEAQSIFGMSFRSWDFDRM